MDPDQADPPSFLPCPQGHPRVPRRPHRPRRYRLHQRLQGWHQHRGLLRALEGRRVHARQARQRQRVRPIQDQKLHHQVHPGDDLQGGREASDRGRGEA